MVIANTPECTLQQPRALLIDTLHVCASWTQLHAVARDAPGCECISFIYPGFWPKLAHNASDLDHNLHSDRILQTSSISTSTLNARLCTEKAKCKI